MANSTAARPTPPAAPSTTTHSSGRTRAKLRRAWKAVRWATPDAAADTRSTAGSTGSKAAADTATRSANAPYRTEPITRSPTARPSTPGPRDDTVPANSLPTVKGTGMVTW